MTRSFLALALLSPYALAAQSTWIVDDDGGPGVDFTDVQSAIDGAADGDVLLVREGSYSGATIDGKSLSILGRGDVELVPSTQIFAPPLNGLVIRNLGADQAVLARGLRFSLESIHNAAGLRAEDCAGSIWLEDCSARVPPGPYSASAAFHVESCASVTLVRCENLAGDLATLQHPSIEGAHGLLARGSSVWMYDCDLRGGRGLSDGEASLGGFSGDAAVRLDGGELLASGCDLAGGHGGASSLFCNPAGDGAPGLLLDVGPHGSAPLARLLATEVTGGLGGTSCSTSPTAQGQDAPAISVLSGSVVHVPGEGGSLELSDLTVAGGVLTETFTGEPGDLALLAYAAGTAPGLFVVPFAGPLLLEATSLVIAVKGALPAGGTASFEVPIAPFGGPSLEGVALPMQPAFVGADGVRLGAPSVAFLFPAL